MTEIKPNSPAENWTKFPNNILDNLDKFTPAEIKILCLMVRKTLGYQNPNYLFALSYISKTTGMSKQTVVTAIDGLIEKKSITLCGTDKTINQYSVNWDKPESVQKLDRSKNWTDIDESGLKIRPEAVQKLDTVKENIKRKEKSKENNIHERKIDFDKIHKHVIFLREKFPEISPVDLKIDYSRETIRIKQLIRSGYSEDHICALLSSLAQMKIKNKNNHFYDYRPLLVVGLENNIINLLMQQESKNKPREIKISGRLIK